MPPTLEQSWVLVLAFARRLRAQRPKEFSSTAYEVLSSMLLTFRNHKTGQCNPGIEALCADTGRGKSRVYEALRQLEGTVMGWDEALGYQFSVPADHPLASPIPVSGIPETGNRKIVSGKPEIPQTPYKEEPDPGEPERGKTPSPLPRFMRWVLEVEDAPSALIEAWVTHKWVQWPEEKGRFFKAIEHATEQAVRGWCRWVAECQLKPWFGERKALEELEKRCHQSGHVRLVTPKDAIEAELDDLDHRRRDLAPVEFEQRRSALLEKLRAVSA